MIPAAAYDPAPRRATPLDRLHPAVGWGGLVLGLVTTFAVPGPLAPLLLLVLVAALAATGLDPGRQWRAARPWLPVALLLLLVHTLTTLEAAPLGRPSWAGLRAGCWALARVAASVAWLGLYLRSGSLDAAARGIGWWLGGFRGGGRTGADLGLALAVALGTAPLMAAEGRRILAVMRMRRSGPAPGGRPAGRLRRLRTATGDRVRVIVPLMETLARRAEGLALALRHRRAAPETTRPPLAQMVGLAAWTAGLVLWWAL